MTRELSLVADILIAMQLIDGKPVFAATDLVGFLACEHLVGLELAALAGIVARPDRIDPQMDLVAKRGHEHELRYLAELSATGRVVTEIAQPPDRAGRWRQLQDAAEATREALRRGDDVIYQATFFDGRWLGLADFLVKVGTPSNLGGWSYEVVDTKLARHVKASALLQICSYVEQLTAIQGIQPEWMYVALGGSAHAVERHRVADYMAYYRMVKAAFEARVKDAGDVAAAAYPPLGTYPEPVEHCEVCRWSQDCAARRRRDDDLSLVAWAPTRLRRALKSAGVSTRRSLAALELPLTLPLNGVGERSLATAREQARIQVRGEAEGRVIYELLAPSRLPDGEPEPNRGLTSLPGPRPGDLFFDIEGDPFALEDGVDYLFGILEPGRKDADGRPLFHAFWAVDEAGQVTHAAEKRAFEQAIDLMMDRLNQDPAIHIYHYAPYEPTAAGRLMGRHATRETEVDRLLRGNVFVDLFRAVRQGLRASVESYSIKKLEPLYQLHRDENLRDAGSSIVAFESWLADVETGEGPPRTPAADPVLCSIEAYNRDDCLSNWLLRDWLEARRVELAASLGEELPRPGVSGGEPGEELSERLAYVEHLAGRLCEGVPDEPAARTAEQQARWLLAQLLSWHRREEKSFWWRYFYLVEDLTDLERVVEREPIGCLTLVGKVGDDKRSATYRYSFPEQEYEIEAGTVVTDPATGRSPGTIVALDEAAGTIDIKRGLSSTAPHPTSLVPCDYVSTVPLRDSLLRTGEWVADNGMAGAGEHEVARRLLMRQPPGQGGPLCGPNEEPVSAALRIVPDLDGEWLAVQGPPGSGKTYLGAAAVVEMVRLGRKVGVSGNSHRVIGNLLDSIAKRAAERGVPVRIGQKADRSGDCTSAAARKFSQNGALELAMEKSELDVVGGTAWLWSRPEFAGSVDLLVIDEAGQFSLANTIAVSTAAPNLLLLGDPAQLDQPLLGTHPPGAEASALGHVLGDDSTMPSDRGLFQAQTRRLHPDLCRFTSEAFYEDRLTSLPGLENQSLAASGRLSGTGVRFVAADHHGNSSASPEEAEIVASLAAELSSGKARWTDETGRERLLALQDVVVVTPYNAQVAEIGKRMPGIRVGTVDKFQGQEAAVSIYSMATSSVEQAPRGMEFLYSLNRLNVASSRARCLAALVANPDLVRVQARTPRQMKLANALCRFLELAAEQTSIAVPEAAEAS